MIKKLVQQSDQHCVKLDRELWIVQELPEVASVDPYRWMAALQHINGSLQGFDDQSVINPTKSSERRQVQLGHDRAAPQKQQMRDPSRHTRLDVHRRHPSMRSRRAPRLALGYGKRST